MTHDLYLQFDNKADAVAALSSASIEKVENGFGEMALPVDGKLADGCGFALSICGNGTGTLYALTGQTIQVLDETGTMVDLAERAAIAGYHINMRFEGVVPASLETFDVAPETPSERFA
ncbi:hypothetical protein FJU08_19085 [Martelella alba]|uniref:Uncharacterized protein n=1 Tax=Martelella alba TaxID=2590451 RepID=A0A506U471_9HYPH|nr:hypothetical protein [Martelella alba]TPW27834.1 hypothetical protein FJU08_19085 [Martelella alba]